MVMITITLLEHTSKGGPLVAIPQKEYEELLRLKERFLWEEEDTDEAVRVFRAEKKQGILKTARSFKSIVGK
ncbi:hypothetical protein A3A21_03050 [Candidatus Jorgensenbacteria bacterium RIFCSPLOWO2_01_FULL_45_25b]|uniref:Prevent-host-death protein n=1 Tax=Candidatus Jorgensenbacteria bacterium RIFCSPLOWO2_01_FULL_45_25b TaxID=1798471 RepID=A0A1F6BUL7_9BACT|nr:MAG: hypothetical protein A3A21_03050 [Candidatus Jorgensenbacteria bacterium RIFCSPLOWO2_01_FULL_45_25b]